MKRYKLLKDLPMFDAGEEGFYLDSDGNLIHASSIIGDAIYPAPVLARHPEILRDWFEEIPEQPKTVWDLKEGDIYYVIQGVGYIDKKDCDLLRNEIQYREVGNAFLTHDEAKKELDRRKAKQILLRDTKGFKPDWANELQDKFYVSFNVFHNSGFLQVEESEWDIHGEVNFATREDAEASIKDHEREWKIYFGVEDIE